MKVLSKEANLLFFLPLFSAGVSSYREEFATLGANSFLLRVDLFQRPTASREANRNSWNITLFPEKVLGGGCSIRSIYWD